MSSFLLEYPFNNDKDCPARGTPPCEHACNYLDVPVCSHSDILNEDKQFPNNCFFGIYKCQHPQQGNFLFFFLILYIFLPKHVIQGFESAEKCPAP